MSLGKLLGKLITAPIKVVAMPFKVIADVADSSSDNLIDTVTKSIEKQVEDIVE